MATTPAINARGGVLGGKKFEIVHYDNKSSPQESVLLLKQATDSGIRYLTQGAGSNVAHALSEAVGKHNSRNPKQSILYFNFAAQDPLLTNEKCSKRQLRESYRLAHPILRKHETFSLRQKAGKSKVTFPSINPASYMRRTIGENIQALQGS